MIRKIIKDWTRSEIIFLSLVIIVVIFLTTAPYWYLSANTPDGYVYHYSTYVNPGDNTVYYYYINQAANPGWQVENLYTSEVSYEFLQPFWVAIGKIGNLFNFSTPFIFHFFRILLTPVFLLVVYIFISYFFSNIKIRKISLAFFSLASGWGWIYILAVPFFWLHNAWRNVTFDFFIPESFPFLAMTISPHFIFSWLVLLTALFFGYLSLRYNNFIYSLTAAVAGALLIFFHPFYVPSLLIILGLQWLIVTWQRKTIWWYGTKHLLYITLIALPSVGYYYYLFFADWGVVVKTMQNFLPSPRLVITLLSYGPALLLSLFGYYLYKKKKDNNSSDGLGGFDFLMLWAVVNFVLIYLPFHWQRRLVEGWFFPLALLAGYAIYHVDVLLRKKFLNWKYFKYFLWVPFIFLFMISNLNFLGTNYFFINKTDYFYYYYPQRFLDVSDWLNRNTARSDIIFTNSDNLFLFLPALVERRQYMGHIVETLYIQDKVKEWEWFFDNDLNPEKKKLFLLKKGIDYLVYDKINKHNIFVPENKSYLTKVYQIDNLIIYKVIK